jgi:hypothetical protein
MDTCAYCGTTIIMGGVRSGTERYCNNKCAGNGHVLKVAGTLPPDVIERQVQELFHGNCPKCNGTGPVDIHKSHRVWSALLLTRWTSASQLSCSSCATKNQAGGIAFCLLLGWWGFPWGLILTPVQVGRNIFEICGRRDSSQPSENLRRLVQVHLGSQALQRGKSQQAVA